MTAPLLIAFLTLGIVLLQMLTLAWSLQQTVQKTARELAAEPTELVTETSAALQCSAKILTDGISLSLVDGGILGINYSKTKITDDEIRLHLTCRLRVPFGLPVRRTLEISAYAKAVRWTGFDPETARTESGAVFITPYGEAWHTDVSCVYLSPSIRQVSGGDVTLLRNRSRERYSPCPMCHPSARTMVYLTTYGTVYHASETCSALRRTLFSVSRTEAKQRGYHACPRCGAD